eukprot:3488190-Rhodomonas_salina.2
MAGSATRCPRAALASSCSPLRLGIWKEKSATCVSACQSSGKYESSELVVLKRTVRCAAKAGTLRHQTHLTTLFLTVDQRLHPTLRPPPQGLGPAIAGCGISTPCSTLMPPQSRVTANWQR